MPFTREKLINDIEGRLSALSDRIKGFTAIGLGDAAKFLEPFAARLLNSVYGWKLADPAPGVPNTKGIDLTDEGNKIAVQVSVQESSEKIKHTVAMLKDEKLSSYTTIVVFFLHHVRHRESHGLKIINIPTLIGKLMDRELSDLKGIIAFLDKELVKPDTVLFSLSPRSNLPTIQRFFGRETELARLLTDLYPDATGWGALIDGPGGMGKTSLAIRCAELVSPGHYNDVIFLSAKQTTLAPHGPLDERPFAVTGFTQILDAIARRVQKPEITQVPADERPRLLIEALSGTRTFLVLDNLETLTETEQRQLFAFLGHLPQTCKALLTSRPLVIATGKRLKLRQLDQTAALQTLADIARDNPALEAAPDSDRLRLITETGGNTLLLTWTAWQVGSDYCTTVNDALAHLRSCPPDNDPLEFIFGDLLASFNPEEERIVATLSYPTEPILVSAIAEISSTDELTVRRALKLLVNRSIVVPQKGEEKFALVPMVADFIRHARREIVNEVGNRLADRAFNLVTNKGQRIELFPDLASEWSTIQPAIPILLEGDDSRLQEFCGSIWRFLEFHGFWDESLDLSEKAETIALESGDFINAGWRAYFAGSIHRLRGRSNQIRSSAERALAHWHTGNAGSRELAFGLRLRGLASVWEKDYQIAIQSYREALKLLRDIDNHSIDVAICLNSLGNAERLDGRFADSIADFEEGLDLARRLNHRECQVAISGNLAELALNTNEFEKAEQFARSALDLAESVGSNQGIGFVNLHLAKALLGQNRKSEALPHAEVATSIFSSLQSPDLDEARQTLERCQS